MKYCLDSNVFIESFKNYYAFDIAPTFWSALLQWGYEEIIGGPSRVYDDLLGAHDDLHNWAKSEAKAFFQDPDEKTQEYFGQIANLVSLQFMVPQVNAFLDCSDPWVIAYAKANNLTVVTMESFRQEVNQPDGKYRMKKIPIPNICRKMNVNSIDTYQFLRELKFTFR